ncbi:MAG: hypothetical protein Kow00107_04940 [Planctomycetota bacterium]
MQKCPKCSYEQADDNLTCSLCGTLLRREQEELPEDFRPPRSSTEDIDDKFPWRTLRVSAAIAAPVFLGSFAMGPDMGMSAFLIALPSMVFRYFAVLVHEMGHAVFAWILGFPAIPAFDFSYGGGVTVWEERKALLVIFVYALLIAATVVYSVSRNLRGAALFAVTLALYALVAHNFMTDVIVLLMGHGFELVIAGVFLYRMLSAEAIIVPAERPLYGAIGLFMVADLARFSLTLIFSSEARMMYGEAKGGGHWMDFDRIGGEYLGIPLEAVAALFVVLVAATPVLAFLAYRFRREWKGFLGEALYIDLEFFGLRRAG